MEKPAKINYRVVVTWTRGSRIWVYSTERYIPRRCDWGIVEVRSNRSGWLNHLIVWAYAPYLKRKCMARDARAARKHSEKKVRVY